MTPIETCINNLCNEPVLYVLQAHPKLHQSLQTIVAQRVQLPSKKEELLGNFKLFQDQSESHRMLCWTPSC